MSSPAPQDATEYWLSRRVRNDRFLLYCFAESDCGAPELRRAIVDRCAAIPELRVRLREDPIGLSYPRWVSCVPAPEQFVDRASRWSDTWPPGARACVGRGPGPSPALPARGGPVAVTVAVPGVVYPSGDPKRPGSAGRDRPFLRLGDVDGMLLGGGFA